MTRTERKWLLGTLIWVSLIFFSSTSVAGDFGDRTFWLLRLKLISWLPSAGDDAGWMHLAAEKSVHLILFGIFGFLVAHLGSGGWRKRVTRVAVYALATGLASEWLQTLFPGRDPALRDVILNVASAILGALLAVLWSRRAANIV